MRAHSSRYEFQIPNSELHWRPLPAEEREELGEHHRRRAPDLGPGDGNAGYLTRHAVARHLAPANCCGVEQCIDVDFQDARHLRVGLMEVGPPGGAGDDGMKAEAADV